METAPVKSQPLHNFSLSFLKWGNQNQMNNHRFRRSDHPPPPPPTDHRYHHHVEYDDKERGTDGVLENYTEPHASKIIAGPGPRTVRNRFNSIASCSLLDKPQKQTLNGERSANVVNDDEPSSVQKPWNLRPRRGVSKGGIEIGGCGGGSRSGAELQKTVVVDQQGEPKSLRLRGIAEVQSVEKREKKARFWIALSKEEIEEDIFVMTGSKPSRRPRKRPRNVQKQLDNVFPGLWLAGLSADDYRVPDPPAKG